MSIYVTLVNDLLDKVDEILNNFVYSGYQALVDYLAAPLGAAIVLFFVVYGVAISQGWINGSVAGVTYSLFKIGVIYFLGMNWAHFSLYIYDLFYGGSSEIGAILLKASPIALSSSDDSSINEALQYVLNEIWSIAAKIFQNGGVLNPGSWISGILIGAAGLFFVGLALLEIVIAKCMLSILFVTAPLFIAFTLFKPTQSFFDRWLGASVGYACLMIFISAGLGIVISLDQWILNIYYNVSVDDITIIDIGTAILVTWVCIGIVKRIALLAMSIGGTISTISADEMFSVTVSRLINSSKSLILYSNNSSDYKNNGESKSTNTNTSINDRRRFVSDNYFPNKKK